MNILAKRIVFFLGILSAVSVAGAADLPADISHRMLSNCDLTGRDNVNKIFPESAASVLAKVGISSGEMDDRKILGIDESSCTVSNKKLLCETALSDKEIAGIEVDLSSYARNTFWKAKVYYEKLGGGWFFGLNDKKIAAKATCDLSSIEATQNYEDWLATQN